MTLLLPDPARATGPAPLVVPAAAPPNPRTGPILHVDLGAVAANTRTFATRTTGAVMAVVKADGFGHGAPAAAATALAHGASWLGVTSIGEGLALRDAGLHAPVLSWLNPVEADYAAAIGRRLDLAVADLDHLEAVSRAGIGARVHLHLDTGMARDGCAPDAWAALCRAARRLAVALDGPDRR